MRDHEWFVIDSLASELSPENTASCRRLLTARLRHAETALIIIFRRLNIALGVLAGVAGVMFVISVIAFFVSRSDAAIIFSAILWPLSLIAVLYLASCLWRYPRFGFLVPGVLKDPELDVFRDHLERMAHGEIEVWDKHDRMLAPAFLRSAWTVLIYSDLEEARAIPLSARFQRYPGGLLTRRSIQHRVVSFEPLVASDVEATQAASLVKTAKAEAPASNYDRCPHWLSTIEEGDFYRLLKELCAQWDGMKSHQIDTMLRAAYAAARQKPDVTVADLRRVATTALKSKPLPIGLDGGTSDIWISRMLGWEKVHQYRIVRLYFTDPEYQLPNRLNDQMGLDF